MDDATPKVFGIVNLTADSFSDGGRFLEPKQAVAHALALHRAGAYAVDLGPASSHPDSRAVEPTEEIRRLEPVIEELRLRGVRISVDSFQPETQGWALSRGVEFLNDIQGFPEPTQIPALAGSSARLVVMHSIQARGRATRTESDPASLPARIESFFERRIAALEDAGISRERLILDPGMGFFVGRRPEASLAVLQCLPDLRRRFGLPLLISVSRKSFLASITGREVQDLGSATLAAELFAARLGVDFLRTHDVAALCDGLAVARAVEPALPEDR